MEPVVPVHGEVPDSNPGLPSFWPGDEQPPPPPPEMVKVNVVAPEPLAPVAVAATLYVPAVVGVPETVPVDRPMGMPGGGPGARQVYDPAGLAVSLNDEIAVPTVPVLLPGLVTVTPPLVVQVGSA